MVHSPILNQKTLKEFRSYYLFCFAWLLPFVGFAQADQIVVKKVPFVNNIDNTIHQIVQDTTGLLWLMSGKKMYISNGEKVIPVPTLYEFYQLVFLYRVASNNRPVSMGLENQPTKECCAFEKVAFQLPYWYEEVRQ